jgi:hypothetical protein
MNSFQGINYEFNFIILESNVYILTAMKEKIIEHITQKTGIPHLVELLAQGLTGSELNSLLLEVFTQRQKNISPALLLQQYQVNRFVHPAETDMIGLLTLELEVLELLKGRHFQPIELSPAAQWGSCSLLAPVDQKKIISATRSTEIVADATNSLALHIADLKKSGKTGEEDLRYCTIHRHIRTQELREKGHTAHFKIGCLVSAGKDTGSYRFECASLQEHFLALDHLLREVFGIQKIRFKLQKREGYNNSDLLVDAVLNHLRSATSLEVTHEAPPSNNYYKGIQYKMIIEVNGREMEIADGGFVDWTQQLLGNNKERLLISGFGLGLLYKIQSGLI